MFALGLSTGMFMLVMGVPIFIVFAITGTIICVWHLHVPWFALSQVMFESTTKYVLLAIPLFIYASNILLESGHARRLVNVFVSLVGHYRGGLSIAMILTMGFFGAISGSILAAIVSIGGIMIPIMEEKGYPKGFAAAMAASAAGLDSLIPPSNGAIIFSAITGAPVAKTFAAGIIPGLFQMTMLILLAMYMARRMKLVPEKKYTWMERLKTIYTATPALLLPVIILGGIYTGTFTPMEAAAVACVWSVIAGFFLGGTLDLKKLWNATKRSAEVTAVIFIIIASASFMSVIFAYTKIPQNLTTTLIGMGITPITFLFMCALVCIILGCFIEVIPVMYLTVPVMAPVAVGLGIELTHLYIASGVFVGMGLLTPPVCVGTYTAAATAQIQPQEVLRHLFPKIILLLMACGVVYILCPWFSTWLPKLVSQ